MPPPSTHAPPRVDRVRAKKYRNFITPEGRVRAASARSACSDTVLAEASRPDGTACCRASAVRATCGGAYLLFAPPLLPRVEFGRGGAFPACQTAVADRGREADHGFTARADRGQPPTLGVA